MGKGINRVTIVGNLGRDPEVRYSQSGAAVCNLSVAVGERKKVADGWQDHTEWVKVTVFGKTAENVGRYLSKGSQIYVEGRMQTRKWQDKDGSDRWTTEVVANEVVFLGGGGDEARQPGRGRQKPSPERLNPNNGHGAADGGFYDDDLPF